MTGAAKWSVEAITAHVAGKFGYRSPIILDEIAEHARDVLVSIGEQSLRTSLPKESIVAMRLRLLRDARFATEVEDIIAGANALAAHEVEHWQKTSSLIENADSDMGGDA